MIDTAVMRSLTLPPPGSNMVLSALPVDLFFYNFSITPPASPNVKLTSNKTVVFNEMEPVRLHARNVKGGGHTPLFTFARDRNFTDVLRSEARDSLLYINVSSLKAGENWVYVRMKTSESCYATPTSVDSLAITRLANTYCISDPDFPGQLITAYPNPIKAHMSIVGLSSIKTYHIRLYSLTGKLVFAQDVSNKTSFVISDLGSGAAIYFLVIYDKTKGKRLGTLKIIKEKS